MRKGYHRSKPRKKDTKYWRLRRQYCVRVSDVWKLISDEVSLRLLCLCRLIQVKLDNISCIEKKQLGLAKNELRYNVMRSIQFVCKRKAIRFGAVPHVPNMSEKLVELARNPAISSNRILKHSCFAENDGAGYL